MNKIEILHAIIAITKLTELISSFINMTKKKKLNKSQIIFNILIFYTVKIRQLAKYIVKITTKGSEFAMQSYTLIRLSPRFFHLQMKNK